LILGAAATLFGVRAQAAMIPPGGVQLPAVAEPDPTGATTVVASTTLPFTAGTFSGTLTSEVLSGDTSNPFGSNFLTFTYKVSNSPGSAHAIERLAVSNFDGFQTDASYRNDPGPTAPLLITRSPDGQVMGFNFVSPALLAGQMSELLVVQTNALTYQPTTASLIDGTTATVASFAPLAVPEPATVTLFALAGGAALVRRRR
jgi:hypothetical protein